MSQGGDIPSAIELLRWLLVQSFFALVGGLDC